MPALLPWARTISESQSSFGGILPQEHLCVRFRGQQSCDQTEIERVDRQSTGRSKRSNSNTEKIHPS